jgi:hypothetical protein
MTILLAESPCAWASRCGRYQVVLQRRGAKLTLKTLFYGFLVGEILCSDIEFDVSALSTWCEEHRRRILPRIVEFESWIGQRYGVDLSRIMGPLPRRDRIADLIRDHNEANVRAPVSNSHNWRLGQVFSELYQLFSPVTPERLVAPDILLASA